MPNSTPAVATLVAGVALLLLLALFSAGLWLYRTGFENGNTEAAVSVFREKIAEYHSLANLADSVQRSLVKP